MAGTFQDGFPLDPVQAVQAATFLTEQERNEWMSWLASASPDDKAELVNTLHEIWIENNTQNQAAVQPAQMPAPAVPPAPIPQPQAAPPIAQVQTPPPPAPQVAVPPPAPAAPSQPAPAPQSVSVPAPVVQAAPQAQPQVEQQKFSFKQVEEEKQQLPPRPQQNPRREERRDERTDRRDREERRPRDDRDTRRDDRPERQERDNRYTRDARDNRPARSVTHSSFADLGKMQTDKTRSVLDKFMKDFAQNRRTEEQSMQRLRDAVLGIEEVTNYADLLAEKILALNNAQVQATKAATKTRDDLLAQMDDVQIRIDDVQAMVERNQEEVERLARRQRAFEGDVKEMLSKLNEQLTGMSSDQFAGSDKLAILNRRLDRIEQVRNARQQNRELQQEPRQSTHERQNISVPQMPAPDTTDQEQTSSASNFMPLKLGNKGKIQE